MLMQKVMSTHGRLVSKPAQHQPTEESLEEHLTIQDQIENLRIKIGLKERYTKVLAEDFEDSRQGASSVLRELYCETRELRLNLIGAINSESQAVQNALRTETEFQLALSEQDSTKAIPWLEDRLCNITKTFNGMLNLLQGKRKKLEESETQVVLIEKWPRPGCLPWEILALDKFHRIENVIQSIQIKRETAFILNSKYHDIKNILQEEKGKYMPNIRLLENQFRIQKSELQTLNQMLHEANTFKNETYKNLQLTEREASDNRKVRRQQMSKMKKSVEKVLAENHALKPVAKNTDYQGVDEDATLSLGDIDESLKQKRLELFAFEEKAHHVVQTMRVNDLTEIPPRYRTIKHLAKTLEEEKEIKRGVRDSLAKQRDQLEQMLCHYKYTGAKQQERFAQHQEIFEQAQEATQKEHRKAQSTLEEYGDVMISLRLGTHATLARLDQGTQKQYHRNADLKGHLRNLYYKTKKLVEEIGEYETLFENKEKDRNIPTNLRTPQVPLRLIRVGYGQAVESESEGDDDDIPDSKVPGRQDIKAKSQRVKQQAILKRGLK